MTGPLPKLNNGRMLFQITTSEPLLHKCQLDVSIDLTTVGFPLVPTPGGSYPWKTAADEFIALVKNQYDASSTFGTVTLEKFVSGAYVPIDTHSVSVSGTSGTSDYPAQQLTLTFRDELYHLDRIVLMGSIEQPPYKKNYAGLNSTRKAIVDDILNVTATHVGYWYQSKSAVQDVSFTSWVAALNRKSRRRLNLL